jgi:hypothetical protein
LNGAKEDFIGRVHWSRQIAQGLTSEDIRAILNQDPSLDWFDGQLSQNRTIAIFREYVHLFFLQEPGSRLNVIIDAFRSLNKIRAGAAFRAYGDAGHRLKSRLKYIGIADLDLLDSGHESHIRFVSDRVRKWRDDTIQNFLLDLIPSAPWSSRGRAFATIRELERWRSTPAAKEYRSLLQIMSSPISRAMSSDRELMRRITREVLTPPQPERAVREDYMELQKKLKRRVFTRSSP